MTEVRLVRDALRPRLGSALVESPGFSEGACALLNGWAPYKESFQELLPRLEDYLFNAMYDRLGPGMTLRTDGGERRHFSMSELEDTADDLLGALLFSLKPWSVNYQRIHDYWIATGSLAAMRCLFLQYGDTLPAEEKQMIGKYLRENET